MDAPGSLNMGRRAWRVRARFLAERASPHWKSVYALTLFLGPFLVPGLVQSMFVGHRSTDLIAFAMCILTLVYCILCWPTLAFDGLRRRLALRGWVYYRFRRCWRCGYEVGGPRVEVCPECGELRYMRLGKAAGRARGQKYQGTGPD